MKSSPFSESQEGHLGDWSFANICMLLHSVEPVHYITQLGLQNKAAGLVQMSLFPFY